MSTHSSILAWRIPWTEDPGGLQSMKSQRVGHITSLLQNKLQISLTKQKTENWSFKIVTKQNGICLLGPMVKAQSQYQFY